MAPSSILSASSSRSRIARSCWRLSSGPFAFLRFLIARSNRSRICLKSSGKSIPLGAQIANFGRHRGLFLAQNCRRAGCSFPVLQVQHSLSRLSGRLYSSFAAWSTGISASELDPSEKNCSYALRLSLECSSIARAADVSALGLRDHSHAFNFD
jgi:hypothetical protein